MKMELSRITDISKIEYIYQNFMRKDFPPEELKPLAAIQMLLENERYECWQLTDGDTLLGYAFYVKQPAQAPSCQPTQAASSRLTEAVHCQPAQAPSCQPTQAASNRFTEAPSCQPAQAPSYQPTEALSPRRIKVQPAPDIPASFDYLLDYLAVVDGYRDRGFGSAFLKMLSNVVRDAHCLIVEVEDPDVAETEEDRIQRERRRQFYLRNGYQKTEIIASIFGVQYRLLIAADQTPIAGTKATNAQAADGCRADSEDAVREIICSLYRTVLPEEMFQRFVKIIH